jgi:nicotinamidase-related amidase
MEEYDAMSNTLLNNENRLIDTFREDYIHVFYIRFIEDDDYEELNGRIIAI